jgi:hypothetical protein
VARGRLGRVLDWWNRPPHIPDRALGSPVIDAALANEMTNLADDLASEDDRLDFSVGSLTVVQDRLSSVRVRDEVLLSLGAYLGEVLIRNAPDAAWARCPKRRWRRWHPDPGVAFGKQMTDPFYWVELIESGKPSETLVHYASSLLEYAAEPSAETAKRLGYRARRPNDSECCMKPGRQGSCADASKSTYRTERERSPYPQAVIRRGRASSLP